MDNKKAVIFGAGKIARGFVGQLLYLSGYETTFVDVFEPIVNTLNDKKTYHVYVLGAPDLDSDVTGIHALTFQQEEEVYNAFYEAEAAFCSVGGNNLASAGKSLGKILNTFGVQEKVMNIVACENWKDAGKSLHDAIVSELDGSNKEKFEQYVGVSEAVMMRTATQLDEAQAAAHPENVWVQNFWYLPIDGSRIKGEFPKIHSVELLDHFGNFLIQKMYTNNTSNAVIAYTGYLLGYQWIAEATNSPEISEILDQTYKEINATLVQSLGVDPKQQEEFSKKARAKYADPTIVDKVIRHAKDPIRKLGPEDRLVGPARMALKNGIFPETIIDTIAKAIFFDEPTDEAAMRLKEMRQTYGIERVLKDICQLREEELLYTEVLKSVEKIRKAGLTKGHE